MVRIDRLSVADWKSRISASNAKAMTKRHKYPLYEGEFLKNCCVWRPPTCGPNCFCQSVGCSGVWSLRSDLDFDTFLDSFSKLWVRGVSTLARDVNNPQRPPTGRWRTATRVLRELKGRWIIWNGDGNALPQVVGAIRRCCFCDDAFDSIAPILSQVRRLAPDNTGVYTSKVISLLFYDIAVPFDSKSKQNQKRCGYDPCSFGGGKMKADAQEFLRNQGMSIDQFRYLDDAPSKYWPSEHRLPSGLGTACSRIFDKLLYR